MQQVYGVLAPPSDNSYTGSVFALRKKVYSRVMGRRECNLKMEITVNKSPESGEIADETVEFREHSGP